MASEDARKLFVAGLPDSVTEEVLRGLFSETGSQVAELTLPRDRMSGRPRGFAFVRLGSAEDAERARQALDGRIVEGRSISVRPFQAEPPGPRREGAPNGGDRPPRRDFGGDRGGSAPDRTLYVGNLPYDATQEEVEAALVANGVAPVLRVHLPVDQDGRRRGFGFVTLGSADVAKTAVDALKSADVRGRRLIVNLAHPKGSAPAPRDGGNGGERPPRSFDGPRFAPPPAAFAPPPPAMGAPGKNDGRRRKRFDGGGEEGGAGRRDRRDHEDRWRDDDDE